MRRVGVVLVMIAAVMGVALPASDSRAAQEVVAQTPAEAAATSLAAAVRVFEGDPDPACQPTTTMRPCIQPISTPEQAARGIAAFSVSGVAPLGLGAGRALLGRDPDGRWGYIAGGQNPVPYQAELPGPLTVCAEGSTLNVRSEPSIDAPVLFTLTDGAAVTAEYFTLTQPGSFPGGERGAGWYYLSAPVEGWSYSGYLAPPLGPSGPPACALL